MTTSANDRGLRNLHTRRDGGREGEVVLHVGGSAVAMEDVVLTFCINSIVGGLYNDNRQGLGA